VWVLVAVIGLFAITRHVAFAITRPFTIAITRPVVVVTVSELIAFVTV
jgi:hypothetical protein